MKELRGKIQEILQWAVLALSEKLQKYKEIGGSSQMQILVNGSVAQSVDVSASAC